MSEFNYTEWMQQNKVGPYTKASLKETWHPDDPSGVDLDDIEDEDLEDFDDISEDDEARDARADKMEDGDVFEAESSESVTITIPENTDYKDLAKAVAKVLIEDYGQHNYKPFLQALIAELK